MPPTYAAAMVDGQVTCTTCHDLQAQCLPQRREERYANHSFLRDGPFRDPATQCFVCHQGSAYRKLNPHRQVSRKAGVNRETCLLCHVKFPVPRAPGGGDAGLQLAGDPLAICSGCHPMAPHPGFNNAREKGTSGWSHLVQPPPAMLKFMQVKAVATGVMLPLEPESGRIVCTTCHDPHDADLAEYAHVRAPEPGDHKLRTQNICGGCHEIQ